MFAQDLQTKTVVGKAREAYFLAPLPPSPLTVATTGEVMQLWNDLVLPVEKKYSVDNK